MSDERPQDVAAAAEPLRLWPGVLAVTVQWLLWVGGRLLFPGALVSGFLAVGASFLGGVAVLIWWAFFSRAPRSERWGGALLMVVALIATLPFIDESLSSAMMGMLYFFYAIPFLSLGIVVWAAAGRRLADRPRWAAMVATILLACGAWTLVRADGVTGNNAAEFSWRWAETPEERLLAEGAEDLPAASAGASVADAAWPGFRGPNRDGVVPGVWIDPDWSEAPPVELWRRRIGPGWSSFAVSGDLLFTQEQRGEEEVVASYRLATGEPVWRHGDSVRFWEAHAGPGPRGTPTLHEGRVYTFGATGILNVLEAGDGTRVWSRDVMADVDADLPFWGLASSPLVVDDVVIVAATGSLVAYDRVSGEQRWFGPDGGEGYSSPHRVTIDGVPQVLLMSAVGATSVVPADGTLLWQHAWPAALGSRILQPAVMPEGDLLLSAGDSYGMRRIAVRHRADGWSTEERWTSAGLKPYFSDFVVHNGYVYGFDGSILACIDAGDGQRQWKGGRYGSGQLMLLPDQDLLLIVSERGELALVRATAQQFTELARAPAIEGKSWNHPVLVGNTLLVRNGQEMVAFRLPRLTD